MTRHHRASAFVLTLVACGVACSSGNDRETPPPFDAAIDDTTADSSPTDGIAAQDGDATGDGGDAPVTGNCIAKINAYRAKVSAPPVTSRSEQIVCAFDQAKKGAGDLADAGKTTFHKYFGQCSEKFQNECWYSVSDPEAVIDWCLDGFWKEGPPDGGLNHYSVMSDPKSTQVACALFRMPSGGYWMTNDYY